MSSPELSREQLLDYIKKQRVKIKKLENDLAAAAQAKAALTKAAGSASHFSAVAGVEAEDPTAELLNAGWNSFSSFITSAASTVAEAAATTLNEEGPPKAGGGGSGGERERDLEGKLAELTANLRSTEKRLEETEQQLSEKNVETSCDKETIEVLRAQVIQAEKG